MSLDALIAEARTKSTPAGYRGRIATSPDDSGQVTVTVSALAGRHRLGPCPVMPRVHYVDHEVVVDDEPAIEQVLEPLWPQRGDLCLVIFDDQERPWVVAWQPV